MKSQTFTLEIISPCFCSGAKPDQAEIRAPSIRGQLRWWFRTLGGFQSLAAQGLSVRKQEQQIFGSAAGDQGQAGKLLLKVVSPSPKSKPANANDLDADMNSKLGYALFPLRPSQESDGRKGMLNDGTPFQISILWRGDSTHWDSVRALLAVWSHIGCLGFRGRRAFGALGVSEPMISLPDALQFFCARDQISIFQLTGGSLSGWRSSAEDLLEWYRSWRQHGQMNRTWQWNDRHDRSKGGRWNSIPASQKAKNRLAPGFKYARRDHNEGLDIQGSGAPNPDAEMPYGKPGETYRPVLGLPIIQIFSSLGNSSRPLPRGQATVNWEWDWDQSSRHAKGRFASPVLLRPHRAADGQWHALVIFVDAHKWPDNKSVFLNGKSRRVSLDLYNAMKQDARLAPFPL